jgi:hypothetical protein
MVVAHRSHASEALREGVTMALYVCIVLEAEFVSFGSHEPPRATAIAIIWGTTLGLAMAHLFAFDLAGRLFSGGQRTTASRAAIWVQLAGAGAVALVATIPFFILEVDLALEVAAWAVGAVVGLTAYQVAVTAGASRTRATGYGVAVLLLAELVVGVKVAVSGH